MVAQDTKGNKTGQHQSCTKDYAAQDSHGFPKGLKGGQAGPARKLHNRSPQKLK